MAHAARPIDLTEAPRLCRQATREISHSITQSLARQKADAVPRRHGHGYFNQLL